MDMLSFLEIGMMFFGTPLQHPIVDIKFSKVSGGLYAAESLYKLASSRKILVL